MVKAVIIDDEPHCRAVLKQLLDEYTDGVEVCGEAYNVSSGIQLIKSTEPDLVFLDIEMPGGNGFSVLNAFERLYFQVIFTTSYDQYALRAIKYTALDYLLKPIGMEELEEAVEKFHQLEHPKKASINFHHINYLEQNARLNEIMLTGRHGKTMIHIDQVTHIESRRDHVVFCFDDQRPRISTQSLSFYEHLLPAHQFFRIHKSYIVNCAKVQHIETGRCGRVVLKNGISLQIAARRKTAFIAAFNQFYQK